MFAVEVRSHIMIAHSFTGAFFGPAQRLHGATFVIDVAFYRPTLNAHGVVVDIGRAQAALDHALAPLAYRNLDEAPEFAGRQTTTEYLAFHLFEKMAAAARAGELGEGGEGLAKIRVRLHESHVARGWYEAAL